ncbi:MAG: 23S rRNA (adenine(2503)-C(2))-methyltransferase RlmN [Dehalococcoidia bacterium]|nr:23S rRNA (adenine(2503)-C(2))-methyltransferase RlmN [Dehalococcoidia bacterium]
MSGRPTFLTDLRLEQVEQLLQTLGEPGWRAKPLLAWAYQKKADSFECMTDLPKASREKLPENLTFSSVKELELLVSHDGTRKALLELWDGCTIETVLVPAGRGQFSVCVSSQVGCAVGCPFCASGRTGFERNLGVAEICDQVLYFAKQLCQGETIGNIVFMGMGEPLTNYLDVIQAAGHLNAPWGFGLGARNITISTAGYIPGIEKLGREKLQLGLAVSLHAADNALRNRLVPLNRKYPLDKLIAATDAYVRASGRRVTFEYALFAGVNDSPEQARQLALLLRGLNCHVNLIGANFTGEDSWQASSPDVAAAFEAELKRLRITVTLRKSLGRDIKAACGQLKSSHQQRGIDALTGVS